MSTAQRIPLAEALKEAESFRALFDGCYERWEIAGSIRRGKRDVGDVEHVVIPKMVPDISRLFSGGAEISAVKLRVAELRGAKTVFPHLYGTGFRLGEKYMGLDFNGRLHEIFCATPDNWGGILTIRTGSAIFCRDLMTRFRECGLRQMDGYLQVQNPDYAYERWDPIPCPDEATYFRAAGLDVADWPPEKREALS